MDFSGYGEDGQPMYRATGDGPQCTYCGYINGAHADGCPNAEARGMFDLLTVQEAFNLAAHLSNGGHAAHNVTESLAYAAGCFQLGTSEEEKLWAERARWIAVCDECCDLAAELRELRSLVSVRMSLDA